MGIITIIVCIGLLFLAISGTSGLRRVFMTAYLGMWSSLLILSEFNLYGLYDVSDKAMTLFLISILCFSIGFYSKTKFTIGRKTVKNEIEFQIDTIINNRYFKLLLIVTMVPLSIYAYRFLMCYTSMGPGLARLATYETGPVFHSYLELEIHNYITFSYFFIVTCVFMYAIFMKKLRMSSAILMTLNILLYLIIGFGRIGFIQVFCCMFIMYCFTKAQRKVIPTIKKEPKFGIIITGCVMSVALVVAITWKRYNIESFTLDNIKELINLFFEQIYVYIVGAFRAFDYQLETLNILRCGRLTFNCIDELIVMALNLIGLEADFSSSGILQNSVPIGHGQGMNAFYTSLFHFYYDFGIIGVIVFSVLFGIVVKQIISRLDERKSLPSIVLASYFFYAMIMLPIKWEMSSPSVLVLIIICLRWDKKLMIKNNRKNKNTNIEK